MNFIGISGQGDPNEENGAYQKAVQELYTLSYMLKMSYKTNYQISTFFEYVVPPFEGFQWQLGIDGYDWTRKDLFQWLSVIRVPDFITEKDFEWTKNQAIAKKKLTKVQAKLMTINEKVVLCLTDSYHMADSCFNIDSNFWEMTNIDVKIKLGQSEGNFPEVEQLLLTSV